MAKSVTYGMGQYRYNKDFTYIDPILDTTKTSSLKKYFRNDSGGINYQDICLDLIGTTENSTVNKIQYGVTYYMELTVPQHRKYQLTLNLKLCTENSGEPDLNHFQNIKRLIIPPTPRLDDITSKVILYEDPRNDNKYKGLIRAAVIDDKHIIDSTPSQWEIHDVYLDKRTSNPQYIFIVDNDNYLIIEQEHYTDSIEETQDWKLNDEFSNSQSESPATVTFKFAFSPKYQQEGDFPFLVIETERSGIESHNLQYINPNDSSTYYGTKLDLNLVQAKIYKVANLLDQGTVGGSQLQANVNQVNHIAVWGHPEQIITINGEEVKIGQTNFYELKDFNITYLGIVAEKNSPTDRFTIDYEYRIVSQET